MKSQTMHLLLPKAPLAAFLGFSALFSLPGLAAENWPEFRGPNCSGIAAAARPPCSPRRKLLWFGWTHLLRFQRERAVAASAPDRTKRRRVRFRNFAHHCSQPRPSQSGPRRTLLVAGG